MLYYTKCNSRVSVSALAVSCIFHVTGPGGGAASGTGLICGCTYASSSPADTTCVSRTPGLVVHGCVLQTCYRPPYWISLYYIMHLFDTGHWHGMWLYSSVNVWLQPFSNQENTNLRSKHLTSNLVYTPALAVYSGCTITDLRYL